MCFLIRKEPHLQYCSFRSRPDTVGSLNTGNSSSSRFLSARKEQCTCKFIDVIFAFFGSLPQIYYFVSCTAHQHSLFLFGIINLRDQAPSVIEHQMAGELSTWHENASARSYNTFYSLEKMICREPAQLSPIGSPCLRHIHNNKGTSPSHLENKLLSINRPNTMESRYAPSIAPSEFSAKAAYYNAAGPTPTHGTPLRSKKNVILTDLISRVAPQKPISVSPPSSTMQTVTWTVVKDPTALMGLTLHAGLAGTEKCSKIVGLDSKILHKIFNLLDPCTATC